MTVNIPLAIYESGSRVLQRSLVLYQTSFWLKSGGRRT